MSMIFHFRMLSDEDDNFLRDYEVPYDLTLLEFHHFICQDICFDATQLASFFKSDAHWEKHQEYTLFDMGEEEFAGKTAPIPMEKIVLGQIIKANHERLIYLFDLFENRGFFLELLEAKKANPEFTYPRVLLANGEAPNQFDASLSVQNKSIFEEAMDDFSSFEGDENYDDE